MGKATGIQFDEVISRLKQIVWLTELTDLPGWRARVIRIARVLFAVVRDVAEGQLTLRAMSLVYTTLLSLVPLLAVSFSVLKAFGVHNQIEPLLLNLLTPLGDQGIEIANNIIGFVENMKVGVLGAVGVAVLFYTVVALMQKIEATFNYTWRVSSNRPLHQRFSDYLSVLMIGPVLVFSAMAFTGTMLKTEAVLWLSHMPVLGYLIESFTRLIPYALIIGAFTFIYIFMPNTKVKLSSAFLGALIAGALWETAGYLFASFVASGNYSQIYSAFATLMFFLIWLYVSWLILLTGASIAFYYQNPDYVSTPRRELALSNAMREQLALLLMAKIAKRYYQSGPPYSSKSLAVALQMPVDVVQRVLDALEQKDLLCQTNDKTPRYLPAQPLDEMKITEVLEAIRHAGEDSHINPERLPQDPDVGTIVDTLNQNLIDTLGSRTIKQMVVEPDQEQDQSFLQLR